MKTHYLIQIIIFAIFFAFMFYLNYKYPITFEEKPSGYCEQLDYKIKKSNIMSHKEVYILEKLVAVQSGKCLE